MSTTLKGNYPTMKIRDIVHALAGWGIPVSPEQLKNPSPEFVEGVYSACLQQVTDLTSEVLNEPVQSALNNSQVDDPVCCFIQSYAFHLFMHIPSQDLYSSALSNTIMLHHLSRFARAARVEDFNARDLHNPDRDRTIILLSAFINFVKFTEQYSDSFFRELRERSEAVISQRDAVVAQLQETQSKIEELRTRITKDKPIAEQLNAENSKLTTAMFQTKDAQAAASREVELCRTERSKLQKRKEAIHSEIKSIEENISRTRGRIVQSPERIKKAISVMSATVLEDKKLITMHEAKARDLQAKVTALYNIEKDVRGCIEQLQTIEREVHSLQMSQKELAEQRDLLEGKTIERNELRLKQERVKDQLLNAQVKLERTQRHAEERRHTSQKSLENLQREYEHMALERRENDKNIEEIREESRQIKVKMQEHLKQSEAELNLLLSEYWKLRHETDIYMETLANKLNMRVIAE
ncbi:Nuf2 family-domain-containing protein [Panaeolus papilionaceus]|nr:Nuf2 family-domain-containing protein [Panaeolus papilionaceus]